MQYRRFGSNGRMVSALGFGCMRLPTTDGKGGAKIDRPEAIRMIRHGIDAGINYLDTAKVYHDGVGEKVVGAAMKGGYRDKVMVATKLPIWNLTSLKEADRILEEQLKDLGVECIDFYLLHCIQQPIWEKSLRLKLPEWGIKKRKQGKIGNFGFSFHDAYPLLPQIVDAYAGEWDFAQIQYNYVNETVQAGTRGLNYIASKGLQTIVMEPLFGGVLVAPSGEMAKRIKKGKHCPVDLALRWLWDKPEVGLVLSGMSNMDQVVQNLEIADRSRIGGLSEAERQCVADLQAIYDRAMPIKCSKCRYCLPCPVGIDIPGCFEMDNSATALPESRKLQKTLYGLLPPEVRADRCTRCGKCEKKCPQNLPIRELLQTVHAHLAE